MTLSNQNEINLWIAVYASVVDAGDRCVVEPEHNKRSSTTADFSVEELRKRLPQPLSIAVRCQARGDFGIGRMHCFLNNGHSGEHAFDRPNHPNWEHLDNFGIQEPA